MNIKKIRKDFPFFKNNPKLVYLDNAATTQKPKEVIDALRNFYEKKNSNIHRGIYKLSEDATEDYENSREAVADFINVKPEEVIFTSGTTNSLNSLSRSIDNLIKFGKTEILISEMEHHSNILPWQRLAKRRGMKLKFFKLGRDFELDLEDLKKKLSKKTAILSFNHISNTLGTINPIKEITSMGKENGAICIIDAAQSVGHKKINLKKIGCDFLVFSSHKMLGPMGTGVLYGKKELLEKMEPFDIGGGMVRDVSKLDYSPKKIPLKFEAGTPNVAGVLGTKMAIRYINKIGFEEIEAQEKILMRYVLKKLEEIENIKIYNPGAKNSGGIISFNLKNLHPHDVASLLDDYRIAIRAGHHCTIPLLKSLRINSTARASFYFYNTLEEVNRFVKSLKKINEEYEK